MMNLINTIVHIAMLLGMPPLLLGVINKVKAFFAGRQGPPLLQLYFDLFKLMRKGIVLSQTTTWLFWAAPIVGLAATAGAGLVVPFGFCLAPLSFEGDFVLLIYLFGLARFLTGLAALDTGSSFEGMGTARDITFACLIEPALFFALMALAKVRGSVSLSEMLGLRTTGLSSMLPSAALWLLVIGLFIVLLAETCRIPVDDPNTHLELTMIHEVMVLDHSGPLLGIILYSAAIKMLVLAGILVHLVLPARLFSGWIGWGLFGLAILLVAGVIGLVESIMARLRLRNVPYLLVAAILFCGFGFLLKVR